MNATARQLDRHLDQVLLFLTRNRTVPVSGEKLARDLGVSHSRVIRVIDRLRGMGVEIQGEPFTGFRLMRLPDVIVPDLLRDRLHTGEFGREIHHLYSVDSTNAFAERLASTQDPPHGTLVLAEAQTAGRGRLGRRWVSHPGAGLYLTLILRPEIPIPLAPLMTLAAAVAAHESIERVTGLDVDVKWPNDLLVGGRKVSGILCELQAELDRVSSMTIGLGINVNHSEFPDEIASIATSLSIETGRPQSRIEVLLDFLATFERVYGEFLAQGPGVVTEAWARASSFASGRLLEVHDGFRTIRGTTDGLEAPGGLRIRQADGGVEVVYSGDVISWE